MFESVASQAKQIRNRKLSSEELVEKHLCRIERINPEINAVVELVENAREQARRADISLKNGEPIGPLHGVPMTIKDCFDTQGVVSTWGTIGRKDFVPDTDATVVKRLKSAGAILIGKTNTPEFTLNFSTYNKIHGFTRNPHDLKRSPGGSSGGAAAAIASGLTPFDIGTDFGGSIRLPSHFCGIVGIKPTSGSVPRTGFCLPPGFLMDFMSHVGPMARFVEDLKLILPVIWGPDSIDSCIARVPFPDADAVRVENLRCAVMMSNGIAEPDDETKNIVHATQEHLENAGLKVDHIRLDGITETAEIVSGLTAVGGFVAIRQAVDAAGTRPDDIANNWMKDPDSSKVSPEDFQAWHDQFYNNSTEELNDQLIRVEEYRSRMLRHMSQYDVLISPVNAHSAPLLPSPGDPPFPHKDASYTEAFGVTGWPSGVVRAGSTTNGMPIGVQITANPWREDIVLAVMEHLERVFPEFERPLIGTSE